MGGPSGLLRPEPVACCSECAKAVSRVAFVVRTMLESAMTSKRQLRHPLYNFLRRQSARDTKKAPRKVFAFGDPAVRAARRNPVER